MKDENTHSRSKAKSEPGPTGSRLKDFGERCIASGGLLSNNFVGEVDNIYLKLGGDLYDI